jgi:hypothetical protein
MLFFFVLTFKSFSDDGFKVQSGEELNYEVSYMGAKLGTIKITTGKEEKSGGKAYYTCKAYIATYKGIPFVDIKVLYTSHLDASATFSHQFAGDYKSKGYWDLQKIFFNYDKSNIYVSKENKDGKYFEKSYMNKKKFSDGLSLFFMARNFLKTKKQVVIPTIIDKDTATTKINFLGNSEKVSVSAINHPVATSHFIGTANWTGVYGLSGNFEGWFSDDEARIPIKAKLQLYLGSVTVELKSWKRKGWEPPK